MRIAELEMHPADTADRRAIAQDDFGLGYCNITKCCTEVCPENIKITDNALIPLKERVVGRKYDPLVWLGNKISRRPRSADTPKIPGKQSLSSRPRRRPAISAASPALGARSCQEWRRGYRPAACEPATVRSLADRTGVSEVC